MEAYKALRALPTSYQPSAPCLISAISTLLLYTFQLSTCYSFYLVLSSRRKYLPLLGRLGRSVC